MKKQMMLLVGLSLALYSTAQNLSMGKTASIGQSWLSTQQDMVSGFNNKEMHLSYGAGLKMVYSFNPNWGISSDLRFSSEGATFSTETPDDVERRYRINYIRHSMQGTYFFGDYGNRVRPKLSVGPQVGLFAGGKSKVKNTVENVPEVKSKNMFTTWDAGVVGAAGANIRLMPNTWLNMDVSYYHGLVDINDTPSDNEIHNRSLLFNIGVLYGMDFKKLHKAKK
jgi:outer membrane protein W